MLTCQGTLGRPNGKGRLAAFWHTASDPEDGKVGYRKASGLLWLMFFFSSEITLGLRFQPFSGLSASKPLGNKLGVPLALYQAFLKLLSKIQLKSFVINAAKPQVCH